MPTYCFTCPEHGGTAEVFCSWSALGSRTPTCSECGVPMGRDFQTERFGGVTHRSKGIYPFTSEDIHPDGQPIVVQDYQHESRLLKSRGLQRHEVQEETRYRFKHRLDRK